MIPNANSNRSINPWTRQARQRAEHECPHHPSNVGCNADANPAANRPNPSVRAIVPNSGRITKMAPSRGAAWVRPTSPRCTCPANSYTALT